MRGLEGTRRRGAACWLEDLVCDVLAILGVGLTRSGGLTSPEGQSPTRLRCHLALSSDDAPSWGKLTLAHRVVEKEAGRGAAGNLGERARPLEA